MEEWHLVALLEQQIGELYLAHGYGIFIGVQPVPFSVHALEMDGLSGVVVTECHRAHGDIRGVVRDEIGDSTDLVTRRVVFLNRDRVEVEKTLAVLISICRYETGHLRIFRPLLRSCMDIGRNHAEE